MGSRKTISALVILAVVLVTGWGLAGPTQGAVEVHLTAAGSYGTGTNTNSVLTRIKALNPDAHLALGDLAGTDASTESAWCAYIKQRVGEGFPFELLSGERESSNGAAGRINNYSACLPNQLPGVVGTYGREYYTDLPRQSPLVRVIQVSPFLTFEDGKWNYQAGDAHHAWLANAIDDARAKGVRWVVVAAHTPCLSIGVSTCPQPPDFYNLLMSKKVDLVLAGHETAYMRTNQLRSGSPGCATVVPGSFNSSCVADTDGDFKAGAGTVFATVGTGGSPLGNIALSDPERGYFASWSGLNANPTFGLLDLKITNEQLAVSFAAASGGPFQDAFTIDGSAPPPNTPPTAAFTTASSGLSVSTNAAGSTDSDGTITAYAWSFGDGATATGIAANHTYSTAGNYSITLTVTDNLGGSGTVTKQVAVAPPSTVPVTIAASPRADSYVRSDQPTANFGSLNQVFTLGSPQLRTYLAFDLPAAPAGTKLVDAKLRLRTTTAAGSGSSAAQQVVLAEGSFVENTLTYQNRPASSGVALGELAAGASDNTAYEVALDAAALSTRLGQQMSLSISASGSDVLMLWSKEHVVVDYRPLLSLRFEAPGTAPAQAAAFLGDSYTAGTGASDPSKRWSSLVAADRGWAELNYGRGGTGYLTTAGPSGCGRPFCPAYLGMLPEVQQGPAPAIVVVAGGQNDVAAFRADEAAGTAKIRETYAQVRSLFPQAQIVAVGPSSPAGTTAGTQAVDQAVQAAAAAVGAKYVSMLNPPVILPSMLQPDGQHVGDAGHRAIADRVIARLAASP